MTVRDPEKLRSHRWFGPDDLRSFGHRSRVKGLGFADEDYADLKSRINDEDLDVNPDSVLVLKNAGPQGRRRRQRTL